MPMAFVGCFSRAVRALSSMPSMEPRRSAIQRGIESVSWWNRGERETVMGGGGSDKLTV